MSLQTIFHLNRLNRNLYLRPSELEEMQTKKLRAILRHAYREVHYYHRKFKDSGVDPDNIKSIGDLERIPTTTKREIQSMSFQEVVADRVQMSKCVKRRTSGSIGQPLTILVNKGAARFEDALWLRTMFENGLKLRDRMVDVHDPGSVFMESGKWMRHLGILRRTSVSIFEDPNRQISLFEQFKPDIIKGYPSALAIIADLCEKRGDCGFRPRLVFTGAELLDMAMRKFIGSTFKAEVFDNYGCNEFNLLAWECRRHEGYHMNMDSVLMEFIDDGERVSPGERGEVVCTSLINWAMPLIRYKLGDVGVPSKEECSCGRTLPLMKVVEGRTDDFLVTLDGQIVSPLIFFPYPFDDFEWIEQFRVIQEKRDRLVIEFVTRKPSKDVAGLLLKAEYQITRIFGEKMQVEFRRVEGIGRDSSGKLRKIISHVSLDNHFRKSVLTDCSSPIMCFDSVVKRK